MTEQVTSIGIDVDSTSVKGANAALDQMAAAGAKSEASIAALITAAREFTTGLREGANQALADYRAQNELAAKAAKTMQDETAAAGKAVKLASEAMQSAIGGFVTKFISGAAVVAAVNAEFQQFSRQIDSLAKLDDAAQAIGETIEKLSVLEGVAKVTGFSFGSVESALARLTKGLAGSDDEAKGAAYALKQLGIESRDSEGKIRSAVDITKEVAIALSAAGDEANKTAYAQAIYGRGAAALIPYLNDLGKANLEGAVATKQQAEAATAFRDAQGALALESEKMRNVIAGAVLPVFTDLINIMLKGKTEAGSLSSQIKALAEDGSLRSWAQSGVVFFATMADGAAQLKSEFALLAAELGGAVATVEGNYKRIRAAFLLGQSSGDPSGETLKRSQELARESKEALQRAQEYSSREKELRDGIANGFTKYADAARAANAESNRLFYGYNAAKDAAVQLTAAQDDATRKLPKFAGAAEAAGKALKPFVEDLIATAKSIQALQLSDSKTGIKIDTLGIDYAIDALKKLRAAGQESQGAIEATAALEAEKFALIAKEIQSEKDIIIAAIDEIVKAKSKAASNKDEKAIVKLNADYRAELIKLNAVEVQAAQLVITRAKSTDELTAATIKLYAEEGKKLAILSDVIVKEKEENESIKRSTEAIGLNEIGLNDLNIARLEAKLALAETILNTEMATELDVKATEVLREQIKVLQERGGLLASKDVAENAKKARDEMVATWKGVGNDITEYIMGGFKNTRDLLKKLFADLILRPTIQPIGNALAGGLQNILFGGGGGSGGGLLSGLFGGSGASALSGLFGGSSGGGGGGILGNLLGGLGNTLGSGLASAFGMNLSAGFSGLFGGASQLVSGTLGGMAELGLGFTEAFGGAVSALGGFGAALGAAIPVIGAIVAFASALGVFDNKDGLWFDFGQGMNGKQPGSANYFDTALGQPVQLGGEGKLSDLQGFKQGFQTLAQTFVDVFGKELSDKASIAIGDWTGFSGRGRGTEYEDSKGYAAALATESKDVMAEYFSRAFSVIDASIADSISIFSGTTSELAQYINSIFAAQYAITALAESIPDLNLSLGDFLKLTDQQKKDIATIAAVMPLFGQDIAQLAADAYDAQTGGIVNAFIKQGDALDDLVDKYNDGKASITDLANATVAFGQSAIQVIASLAAAKAQIDNDIAGGIRSIETTGLSPEELNRYLSNEAEALRAQLQVTTDPDKIADLVARIIANSTQVFSGLSPEEQAARRPEFVSGLTTLNKEADDRIKKLNEIILANTKTTFDAAKEGFDAAIKEFNAGAATTAAAADKLNYAANTITDTFARGLEVSFNVVDRTVSAVGGLN